MEAVTEGHILERKGLSTKPAPFPGCYVHEVARRNPDVAGNEVWDVVFSVDNSTTHVRITGSQSEGLAMYMLEAFGVKR